MTVDFPLEPCGPGAFWKAGLCLTTSVMCRSLTAGLFPESPPFPRTLTHPTETGKGFSSELSRVMADAVSFRVCLFDIPSRAFCPPTAFVVAVGSSTMTPPCCLAVVAFWALTSRLLLGLHALSEEPGGAVCKPCPGASHSSGCMFWGLLTPDLNAPLVQAGVLSCEDTLLGGPYCHPAVTSAPSPQ